MEFRSIGAIITIIILIATSAFTAFLAWNAYNGEFTPVVEHPDFRFNTSADGKTNWEHLVTYRSKGAFIAGEKIDVNIELKIRNDAFFEMVNNGTAWYVFENSFQYPLSKISELELFPAGGGVFSNISNKNITIDYDIIYTMPGTYGYLLIFITQDRQPIFSYNYHNVITIAPLETCLEVRNSNILLALTFVAISISFLGILTAVLSKILRKNK